MQPWTFLCFGLAALLLTQAHAAEPPTPVLVIDMSRSAGGEVIKVEHSIDGWTASPLIKDVEVFHAASTGHFIAKLKEAGWVRGHVNSPQKAAAIAVNIPDEARHRLDLSPDGRHVVFDLRRDDIDRLTVLNIDGDAATVVEEKQGRLWEPAWSPDGRYLAYYAGGPEAIVVDGFELRVRQIFPEVLDPVTVAPASLLMGINPSRRKARWSPDSSRLLFEARYENRPDAPTYYTVKIDGAGLKASRYGTWSTDGQRILTFEWTVDPEVGIRYSLAELPADAPPGEEKDLGIMVPAKSNSWEWSPSGDHIAVVTATDMLIMIDRHNAGRVQEIVRLNRSPRLEWLMVGKAPDEQ